MNRKQWLLGSLTGVLALAALFDGLYFRHGIASTPATNDVAGFLSAFLLVLWIDADSRDHPQVERCFDYGYLLLISWPLYLPYYMWRTRGVAGLFMLVGFVALFLSGYFIQWSIYYWVHL
jgi:hypothetical protein